jgi:glycosyltransferase involved in cell wall biosynthesis
MPTGAPDLTRELAVVIPVYNEGAVVERVVREWIASVRTRVAAADVWVVDDGSSDATAAVLDQLAWAMPAVTVLRQANAGHGQACVRGYRSALEVGARWILQVDSDGQCDPRHFGGLWDARLGAAAVMGRRRRREDGLARTGISRLLSLMIRAATGVGVPDANSPYRLMRADALARALVHIPADAYLANVFLAIALEAGAGISWMDVGFRRRILPVPFGPGRFLVQGACLWRDLRRWRRTGGLPARTLPPRTR